MTAFNLKDEKEEGHFDENGNFVWKKHERKVQEDAWLDNISETQIDQALHAKV
jgi:CD2 antigen cytoplasmic tail-binding protein 2